MHWRGRVAVGAAMIAAMLATVSAAAQPKAEKAVASSAEPEMTTATFGDWTLRCQRSDEAGSPARVCEVTHAVQVQGQPSPVLQLAIGKPGPGQEQQFVIVLPANVSVTASPEVEVEGSKNPVRVTWRRCAVGACFADVELKSVGAQLVAAERGNVKFTDAANRPVTIPFSLRGLKQALDALNRA